MMATGRPQAIKVTALGLSVAPGKGGPLYRQIRERIDALVLAGRLLPGQRLPTVRDVAAALAVNPMTVSKAYKELAAAGTVEARSGGGTFIRATAGSGDARLARREDRPVQPRSASISQRLFELARAPGVIAFTGNYPRPEDADAAAFRTCLAGLMASGEAEGYFRYDPPAGRSELREQLAVFLAGQRIAAAVEDIVVTSGGQQAIDLVLRSLVPPGAPVIVERPAYFGAINALRAARAQILEVPMLADGMDLDVLETLLVRYRPRLLYTNPTFQNPTGVTMSLAKRRALLELARRHGVPILEDDHSPELRFSGTPLPALRALATLEDVVFYARGFGKTLVPGVRLGFLLTPPAWRTAILATKALTDLQSNALMQGGLAAYLASGSPGAAFERMRQSFAERRAVLLTALAEGLGPELFAQAVAQPEGGLSLWLTLPPSAAMGELYFRAVRRGVAFAAGEAFYATKPPANTLRLSFGLTPPAQLVEGARRLCYSIHDLLRQTGSTEVFV